MVLYVLYAMATAIFIPYYNWNYVKSNGVKKWLFFGEVVATAKAVAWPYFLSRDLSLRRTISHVSKAIDYSNKAKAVLNKCESYQIVPPSDMETIIQYRKKALAEAKEANIEAMNRHYPGFGDHFKNEFIQGHELFIKSYEAGGVMTSVISQGLLFKWGDWFNANIDSIRKK